LYELFQSDDFKKDMKKLDKSSKEHLEKVVQKLLENPMRFKPLEGRPGHYRLRFEHYRLVYKVEGNQVWLLFVRKRDENYRFLRQ